MTPGPVFRFHFVHRVNALQRIAAQCLGPIADETGEGVKVADAGEISDKMADLQKMRVALILAISAETSKLLSRRQRVSGKEIEVMCAERDLAESTAEAPDHAPLELLLAQDAELKAALAETEQDIAKLEDLMKQVNADIAALCQA